MIIKNLFPKIGDRLRQTSSLKIRFGDLLALIFFFIPGVIGIILFSYYSTQPQSGLDGEIKDGCVAVWASSMTLFTGGQITIRIRVIDKPSGEKKSISKKILNVITMMTFLLHTITFFGYALSGFEPYSSFYMFLCLSGNSIVLILLNTQRSNNETYKTETKDIEIAELKVKENSQTAAPKENSKEKKTSRCWCLFLWYNCCNQLIFFLFSILLAIGACTFAEGVRYQVRGSFLTAGGYSIAYRCEGPKDSNRPVIIMDADGSHGMYDFWELQAAFTKSGRRSCIFDKPGIGWSSYFRSSQNVQDLSNFYGELIQNLGERPQYTLLAWGGGGSHMFKWARSSPDLVSSFVFLNVYGDSVEWRMYQFSNNATKAETETYISQALIGRTILFSIIRGLAIPWGVMAALVQSRSTREASWFY